MNVVDVMVLSMLALGDLTMLVYLRRRRARHLRRNRMGRSLAMAVRRELNGGVPVMLPWHRRLRAAVAGPVFADLA